MALSSPSHRFGQIIGDVLEEAMIQYLRPVADKYSLYLDHRHARPARRGQKEVRWVDINGNTHKLDIVMERKGNETILGEPCVFIEMAWRRYTKHSKNKAQEISGAIRPLIAKYRDFTPFFGAIVAGVFTQSSLNQMRSEGFEVVYIPIGIIEKAFGIVGINAHWEENTPDYVLQQKVDDYERLDSSGVEQIKTEILRLTSEQLSKFCHKLSNSLERKIDAIRIISIFGDEGTFSTIDEACNFIVTSNYRAVQPEFYRYEIYIRYSNGDKLEAQYTEISNAVAFLQSLGL
jgi:hypothetical protein